MDPFDTNTVQDFLRKNLEQQIQLHQSLLVLLEEEATLTANCSLSDLSRIQDSKQILAISIKEKEQERLNFLQNSFKLSDSDQVPKLAEILEFFSLESQHTLENLKQNLLDHIESIKNKTAVIATKTKARLLSIRTLMKAIENFHQVQLYEDNGSIRKKQPSLLVKTWV